MPHECNNYLGAESFLNAGMTLGRRLLLSRPFDRRGHATPRPPQDARPRSDLLPAHHPSFRIVGMTACVIEAITRIAGTAVALSRRDTRWLTLVRLTRRANLSQMKGEAIKLR